MIQYDLERDRAASVESLSDHSSDALRVLAHLVLPAVHPSPSRNRFMLLAQQAIHTGPPPLQSIPAALPGCTTRPPPTSSLPRPTPPRAVTGSYYSPSTSCIQFSPPGNGSEPHTHSISPITLDDCDSLACRQSRGSSRGGYQRGCD